MNKQHIPTCRPSDSVFIEGLEVDCLIGVYDWERDILQRLVFDIWMDADIADAAGTDDVVYALDYSQVAEQVLNYVKQSQFQLIEALVEQVARLILAKFAVSKVKIRLQKPGAVPEARTVGVEIVRYAADGNDAS